MRRLLGAGAPAPEKTVPDEGVLRQAVSLMQAGNPRAAIKAFQSYLETDPYNVGVLNDLGSCYAETGHIEQALAVFELAWSLDDTFIPTIVNHAKLLNEQDRAAEAVEQLRRAKICEPGFPHNEAVYSTVLLKYGDPANARRFQQKAWLANFDSLRAANAILFWMAYDDVDEMELAAEHRFWAETLKPLPQDDDGAPEEAPRRRPLQGRRIRIGYWSPDFRGHSVRFFFRPLLEAHDRERFEIILFHDFPGEDAQTAAIRPHADEFHDVHELPDAELRAFIRDKELDILVDLAGHTSHNRATLLQSRMAPLQMNALGYPPTTGLRTVDAKLIDAHVLTPDADRYYVEQPVALPTAFWCFDPMEEAPLAPEPPVVANGHVTFACMGNNAKITEAVGRAWARILAAVPDSRLLIRSISFSDPTALAHTRNRLAGWGLPMERVELCLPERGLALYGSYNDVDIVLDTFPFNGGTTTCFATYMGVPVVTLAGRSLIGRMGLSVMTNLGAPELAVTDIDSYVARAVAVAGDIGFLRRFKQEARGIYERTALGNGKLFAAEFEQAVVELIERQEAGAAPWQCHVPALPQEEIVRRAYATMRNGLVEPAQRILAHCLREYPDAGAAHVLQAQITHWAGRHAEAIDHLTQRLERLSAADQVGARIALVRMHLLRQEIAQADAVFQPLRQLPLEDALDAAQVAFYAACLHGRTSRPAIDGQAQRSAGERRMHFLVPCDSGALFDDLCAHIEEHCAGAAAGWTLSYERCQEDDRVAAYRQALAASGIEALVLLQKNVRPSHPRFVERIAAALEDADCVGMGGALRWARLDWRSDRFESKAGAFLTGCPENPALLEAHVIGPGDAAFMPGMAILDGSLLALRPGGLAAPEFDEALIGCTTLLEEAWTHAAGQRGWRLAVHRNLGVQIASDVALDQTNRMDARLHCNEVQGFDPYDPQAMKDDTASASAPLPDLAAGLAACDAYFAGSAPR